MRLPTLDSLREEDMHALTAKARRREERAELAPLSAGQSDLFLELPLRTRQRLFAGLERPGRQLDQPLARRFTQLPNERHVTVGVDRDDRSGAGMLNNLALVSGPR